MNLSSEANLCLYLKTIFCPCYLDCTIVKQEKLISEAQEIMKMASSETVKKNQNTCENQILPFQVVVSFDPRQT